MIIIFGLKRLRKPMGSIMLRCSNCGWSPLALFRISTWFALFFIPIIPVSFKFYAACPNCKRLDQVTKAQIDQANAQAHAQGQHPDVRPVADGTAVAPAQPATLESAVNQWAAVGTGATPTATPAASAPGAASAIPAAAQPPAQAPLPPAGWFPDPGVAAQQRYWDGQRWTEHTAPLS